MTREEFYIKMQTEIDMLKDFVDKMIRTSDAKQLGENFHYANKCLSDIFLENLDRIIKEEELKDQILEDSLEIEEDYDVNVTDCIRNCSTCRNNVEFPPPHTCDICTSLDQEEEYEMWEPKE